MDCEQDHTYERSSPKIPQLVAKMLRKWSHSLTSWKKQRLELDSFSRFIPLLHALQRSIPVFIAAWA